MRLQPFKVSFFAVLSAGAAFAQSNQTQRLRLKLREGESNAQ